MEPLLIVAQVAASLSEKSGWEYTGAILAVVVALLTIGAFVVRATRSITTHQDETTKTVARIDQHVRETIPLAISSGQQKIVAELRDVMVDHQERMDVRLTAIGTNHQELVRRVDVVATKTESMEARVGDTVRRVERAEGDIRGLQGSAIRADALLHRQREVDPQ